MHLLDQIVTTNAPVVIQRADGIISRLPGANSVAQDLKTTETRYLLDRRASGQCWDFLLDNEGMLHPENQLLRLGLDRFWLEWLWNEVSDHGMLTSQRAGALIESCARGRRGRLQSFWEDHDNGPTMAQAKLEFDLDEPIARLADQRESFQVTYERPGAIAQLLQHVLVRLNDPWVEELSRRGAEPLNRAGSLIGSSIFRDFAFALGFSALLSSRERIAAHQVSRSKLNVVRQKRGKPPLLDHFEVTMLLSAGPSVGDQSHSPGRAHPRLHYVRGHMVRRAGKAFWRGAHLRGDACEQPLHKTVTVLGGAPGRESMLSGTRN